MTPTPPCLLMSLPAPHVGAAYRRVPYNVFYCDVSEYNEYFTGRAVLPRSYWFCTSPHLGRFSNNNVQSKKRLRQVPFSGPHLTASAHCTVYATCCYIVSLGICLGTSHTRMGLESSLCSNCPLWPFVSCRNKWAVVSLPCSNPLLQKPNNYL